jgi:hypothetical protein
MICEELLDLQKASADDMRKSVYDNYTVFIRSLLTFLLPTELAAIFEVARCFQTRTKSIIESQNRTAVGCLILSSSWDCGCFEQFEL